MFIAAISFSLRSLPMCLVIMSATLSSPRILRTASAPLWNFSCTQRYWTSTCRNRCNPRRCEMPIAADESELTAPFRCTPKSAAVLIRPRTWEAHFVRA